MLESVDDLKAQIEALILRQSEDFFDEPKDLIVLRVTIRVACEFFDFLRQADGSPDLSEAGYIAGTIRAAMDEYCTLAQWARIISGLESKGFNWDLPSDFSEMKASYNSIFQQLMRCNSSAQGIGSLRSLGQIMLLFMTVYFPSL